jgi:uncharacterized membrane protein YphA (DoxX/SURF4 family)
LGAIFVFWAYKSLRTEAQGQKKAVGIAQGLIGLLLIVGLWTQIVALLSGVYLAFLIGNKVSKKAFLTDGINYYLILFIMAVSLLFTGAGFIAFDYPL